MGTRRHCACVDPQFSPSTLALISGVSPVLSCLYVTALAPFGLNQFSIFVYVCLWFTMVRLCGSF